MPFFASEHGVCSMHRVKMGVHDAKSTDIFVFGISEKNLKNYSDGVIHKGGLGGQDMSISTKKKKEEKKSKDD